MGTWLVRDGCSLMAFSGKEVWSVQILTRALILLCLSKLPGPQLAVSNESVPE